VATVTDAGREVSFPRANFATIRDTYQPIGLAVRKAIPVIAAILGLSTLFVAAPASAVSDNTWSNAVRIATAGPAGFSGFSGELDNGTQWVVASARSDGNVMGALASWKSPSGSFDTPGWIVNAPGAADGDRSIGYAFTVLSDGTDIVALWRANNQNGMGTIRLGAIRYDGATDSWSLPIYQDVTTTNALVAEPSFVMLNDGNVLAAYGDANADMQSALFTTSSATWGANVAVGAQMDPGSYYEPSLAVAPDNSVWMSYNAVNTPMAVKWTAGSWGTPESVRGPAPNSDFDASNDDESTLALVPSSSGLQPAVAYGLSGANRTDIAIRNPNGTWTQRTALPGITANSGLALGIDASGNAALAMRDYNQMVPVWATATNRATSWSELTEFSVPGLNTSGLLFTATPAGDVAVTTPANEGTSPNEYGSLYAIVHRAGATGFTDPTLISTETTVRDNQGAYYANVSFSSTSALMPIVWTSWADDAVGSYALFWTDAGSLFPLPGFAPEAPSITTLLASKGAVTVVAKRATSGSVPSSFVVTAEPGGSTCTITSTTSGTCRISGLINGRVYTFTAIARNNIGDSTGSIAAGPAVPGNPISPSAQPIPRFLPLGDSYASVYGIDIPVTTTPKSTDTGIVLTGDGFAMTLGGLDANGKPAKLTPSGALTLDNGRQVQTSGSGFMPNSNVNLYVDSPVVAPRSTRAKAVYVGTVRTNANGSFRGKATLPASLSNGLHNLQAAGVTTANVPRALTLSVRVIGAPSAVRNLTATVSPATAEAILTWASPASTNGSAITGYLAKYKLVPGNDWTRIKVSSKSILVGGLVIGCVYRAKVAAVNSVGVGSWTNVNFTATGVLGRTPRGDLCPA
jgi:hypothetical protein